MANENKTPSAITVVAKPVGMAGMVITLLTELPAPYDKYGWWALSILGAIGLIATQIPKPADGSKWMPVYKVLSILALNWGEAANAAILKKVK